MTEIPVLHDLMSSYFHQDYDLMGDSDNEILIAFVQTHSPEVIRQAVAEIDHVLATPPEGLLKRYAQATGEMNMIIGDNDESAREWLVAARRVFEDAISH